MAKIKLINDRFAGARQGKSNLLDISCSKCQNHILTYQKDGLGGLVRLYLDRVHAPAELVQLQFSTEQTPALRCGSCDQLIATPMIYEAESRRAFRLIRGSFIKKKHA